MVNSEISSSFGTPAPVFKTYIGNLLYSTLDLTDELAATTSIILGQVDIENIFGRDFADTSIGDIQHKRNLGSVCSRGNDSSKGLRCNILSSRQKSNVGSNPSGLSVDTAGGRKVVTVAEYSRRISSDAFKAVIALADEIPLFTGLKASSKASARSLMWLKQLRASTIVDWKETYLFGVTGAFTYDQHNSPQSASLSTDIDQRIMTDTKNLLQQGCDGLVVGGAGMGETLHQLGVAVRSVKKAVTEYNTAAALTSAAAAASAENVPSNSIANDITSDSSEKAPIFIKGEILIMVQEMDSLHEILFAIDNGGDLIGTNFPQLLSNNGLALSWNLKQLSNGSFYNNNQTHDTKSDNTSSSNRSRDGSFDGEKRKSSSVTEDCERTVEEYKDEENPIKRQNVRESKNCLSHALLGKDGGVSVRADSTPITDHKYARTGTTTTVITTIITAHKVSEELESGGVGFESIDTKVSHNTPNEYQCAQKNGGILNLWEETHRKDLRPILDDCHCHACNNHTRAYIHHLLIAKEMLGDILIYCHNQYQTVQLFNEIREVKVNGQITFQDWSAKLLAIMHEK